jgi:hypothetical protein
MGKYQYFHFTNYDVKDSAQFLALGFHNYEKVVQSAGGQPIVLTQDWAKPLHEVNILSLVNFP